MANNKIVQGKNLASLALACLATGTAFAEDGRYTYADLDGKAYFDTGYMVKSNSVFRFKMAARSSTANYQSLFSNYESENTQIIRVCVNGTSATDFIVNLFSQGGAGYFVPNVVSARGNPVEGVLAYEYAILNGIRYTPTRVSGTASTKTLKIGGSGGNAGCATRFWYLTIEEDGVAVHDYIPYSENGKSGIKDLVTGGFLGNSSSEGTVTLAEWVPSILDITASIKGIGSPSPSYGVTNGLAAGESFTVSCGAMPLANADGTIQYSCTGWKLYNESNVVVDAGAGTSLNYVHPNPAAYRRLEWQWTISQNKPGRIACYFSGGTRNDDTYTIGPRINTGKKYPLADSLSMSAWVRVSPNIITVKPCGPTAGTPYYSAAIAGQGFFGDEEGFGLLVEGWSTSDPDNENKDNDAVSYQVRVFNTIAASPLVGGSYKANTLFTADEWHHYLLVRDKTAAKVRFYVDGELLSEKNCPSEWNLSASKTFAIAYNPTGNGGSFCGYIADLALWDVALSTADARHLYRNGLENVSTAPIAYFPLNDGWGNSVKGIYGSTTNYYSATDTLQWKVVSDFKREPGLLIFVR